MKKIVVAAAGMTAIALTSCSKESPANVCSSADTQQQVFGLLYDAANQAVASVDNIPNLQSSIQSELNNMRHGHLLSFAFETLNGYDKITKKISCSAKLKIGLEPQDQTGDGAKDLTGVVTLGSNYGLNPPAGLAAGSAQTSIDYSRQPNAAGDGTYIFGIANAQEAVSGLVTLALARALNHAPKNQDQQTQSPAQSQAAATMSPDNSAQPDQSPGQDSGGLSDNDVGLPANAPPPAPPKDAPPY